LRRELGAAGDIALHEPWFRGNEWTYVRECIDTGWVSTAGAYVGRFEALLAGATAAAHAVATVNGTAALHLALHALGVGRGDAVICPALTFVATANAVAMCGATPVFVDSDPATLGLDPAKLERFLADRPGGAARVAAIVPVHIFGHPADMDAIRGIAARHGIPVIEDATEALGSRYRGRACGAIGAIGVLSFNGNKIVTTGGGGAVLCNDPALAARLRHLATTARRDEGFQHVHDDVGFNYRLPNLNAALGCAQLENLDEFVELKRGLAHGYAQALADVPALSVFTEQSWARSNYWLSAVFLRDRGARDAFLAETNARGIATRPCWRLLCDLPMFRDAPRGDALPGAREIEARLVNLPSSPQLMAAARIPAAAGAGR
jgi:perosamine synthetase